MKFKHRLQSSDHYEVKLFCHSHFGPDCFPTNDGRWTWDLPAAGYPVYRFADESDFIFFMLNWS